MEILISIHIKAGINNLPITKVYILLFDCMRAIVSGAILEYLWDLGFFLLFHPWGSEGFYCFNVSKTYFKGLVVFPVFKCQKFSPVLNHGWRKLQKSGTKISFILRASGCPPLG